MSTLMAFDTSYLYYRAFFGVPTSVRGPDGRPINAVRGLLDFMARLIEQYRPDAVAAAWDDDWRPAWRTELLESYKAHRVLTEVPAGVDVEETPDELAPQVPIIRQVLEALGVPPLGAADHEADDVLASLAARHDGRSLVVTGDRDLFQLVDADTFVVWVGSSVANNVLVDKDWVAEKYGISPADYVAFSVLRGDPSDGLPGIKGVGEKSAAKLVKAHPGLADLLAAAAAGEGSITPAIRARITESGDYLARAEGVVRTVATLDVAAPTSLPVDIDEELAARLRDDLGLGGSMDRIVEALTRR